MAVFIENVNVWIRDGSLSKFQAAEEVFRKAEIHCGQTNSIVQYRALLQEMQSISLLYEGVMGLIGANIPSASPMFASCRQLLGLVRERFDNYVSCISNSASRKSFMCSPKEFDDMLTWTGAFKDVKVPNHDWHALQMRKLYAKLAASRSNDFLETGIWAPDFPIQRPSPSSTTWAGDMSHAETSCSKDFTIHHAFSPGTFGAYCLCRHAKTVMVSFLKRPEGCRMPLNLIVERCPTLPKYVIYDFACGTQRAAAALSGQISRHIRFVIDPFHFPGHKTCSLAMHQANYKELKGLNTESQEQRNSSIKVMERTLRASRDIHFMHFVILAHAYRNLKAIYLDYHDGEVEFQVETASIGRKGWLKWVRDNLFGESQQ